MSQVRIGFGLPVSGSWAQPANVLAIARRAEELGYSSLWTFQRLLAPADGSLGPVYASVLDPVAVLGMAAAVTQRAELGVAILNLPFFSPALLAKQLASIDVLSGGRLVAGLGLGWLPQEFAASNVPYERRGARADDFLVALRALWGPDPVSHQGEFYQVPPSLALPKPVRRPPVLLGGEAPAALERAGRVSDGWISNSRVPPDQLHLRVSAVKAAAERAGRDPDALRFICRGVVLGGPRTRPLTGELSLVREDLAALGEQGITEVFVDLNFDPAIGDPGADPVASMARAHDVIEALAPHR
jgi:probable F420-dependent oxidoreductase